MSKIHDAPTPVLIILAVVSLAIWVAVVLSFADSYNTYPGDAFRRVHFGEMDNVFIDTVHVLSVTVRGESIQARIVESNEPIFIKYPDRLEAINGGY